MRWIWMALGLLVLAAVIIVWQEMGPRPGAVVEPVDRRSDGAAAPLPPVEPSPTAPASRAPVASPTAVPHETTPGASTGAATGPLAANEVSTPTSAPPLVARPGAGEGGQGAAATPPGADTGGPLPEIRHATVAAGSFERQPDGSLIADGRFRIAGAGTEEDPFRVSWECLASAQETYMPRLSEMVIPERIAMLHGKVVRMEGFVAFPLLKQESEELLIMLNQWDGCCIGVPPTPYDAIEVKLAAPVRVTGGHRAFNYGSVTGVFKVEPFLIENWLAGLYLLEEAHYDAEGL